jgi:hypothetical protein
MRQLWPPTLNAPDETAVPMPVVALYCEYPWTMNTCQPVAVPADTMDVLPPAVAAEEDDM